MPTHNFLVQVRCGGSYKGNGCNALLFRAEKEVIVPDNVELESGRLEGPDMEIKCKRCGKLTLVTFPKIIKTS